MTSYGSSSSHLKISQQIKQSCSSGVRQLYGLQIRSACDAFMAIDKNGDGELCSAEIFQGLKRLGASLSQQQVSEWIAHLDVDTGGSIDATEFITHVEACSADQARDQIKLYVPVKNETRKHVHDTPVKSSTQQAGKQVIKKLQKLLKKGKIMVNGVRVRDAVSLFNSIDTGKVLFFYFNCFASLIAYAAMFFLPVAIDRFFGDARQK